MSDPQQVPIYDAQAPSEESKRVRAIFDDIASKQLDTLDESGKSLIERIATFLGVLFGISILSNNFPPPYLKGHAPAKIMVIVSLVCFLLSIGAGIWATQARSHRRYNYNMTRNAAELQRMIKHKRLWLRIANLLFALGTIALAVLLIIIVWNL
jgi:hypothetical protein